MAVYKTPALLTVGGIALPEPSTYEANTATIVDSARAVDGHVVGNVILADVSKVSASWRFLTPSEWASILELFSGNKFYNSVTFYSQDTATWMTKTMYVSDRNAGMFRRDPDKTGTPVVGWLGAKLSLIEV
jgi:hypothetical protein